MFWPSEIFVFPGQEMGGLHGWLGHDGKEENPAASWNQILNIQSTNSNIPSQQFHAENRLNYYVCFLTTDVTGSDLSEGQLQDCEDVTKAELDNVVEYDASDS
jgi:hypothetical protein